ncbi:unnamed protein product, partial [Polarella glacialis]
EMFSLRADAPDFVPTEPAEPAEQTCDQVQEWWAEDTKFPADGIFCPLCAAGRHCAFHRPVLSFNTSWLLAGDWQQQQLKQRRSREEREERSTGWVRAVGPPSA